MLQKYFSTVAVVVLLARGGFSQCYTNTGCTGDTIPAADKRDCCVGTSDGLAYLEGTDCMGCVVHGFLEAVYDVSEDGRLDTMFQLNVKGTTSHSLILAGTIDAEQAGTADDGDFEEFATPINVRNNEAEIRLFTTNDEITLEYDDKVSLVFTPGNDDLISGVEGLGEFIRSTAIVNIVDNDLLNINFEESDYVTPEASSMLSSTIRLQFRENQNPFTITLYPADVSIVEGMGLGRFINAETIVDTARATTGEDFTDEKTTIEVPAHKRSHAIPNFFSIIDDNIDEDDQSFAIVAELGVPVEFGCFQTKAGEPDCFGQRGATEIRIMDNDFMIIGFELEIIILIERELFQLMIEVRTLRTAEREHGMIFRLLESSSNATVEPLTKQVDPMFDATFGTRDVIGGPLEEKRFLQPGESLISPLITSIRDDFIPEPLECYTIGIFPVDVPGRRELFMCNDTADYFCEHTICIDNDDEAFVVAFVETEYTVDESAGSVEVCVQLLRPTFDIDRENITIFVIDDPLSMYVPADAPEANPEPPDFLGMFPMASKTDFSQQLDFLNAIEPNVIRETSRVVCYDQPIYEDLTLELDEYAGLTLGVRPPPLTTVLTEIEPLYDQASILILDNDEAVVGLEKTLYSVSEDVGTVEVCAIVYSPSINCSIQFPFNVSLSTIIGSAESPMDYGAISTILTFQTCNTTMCTDILIVDDTILEDLESFNVTLERTPALDTRITLDPVDGVIYITDNEAVVGLEETFYQVREDEGVVQVCAIVYIPNGNIACPINFPFDVKLSTSNGDAVSTMDYESLMTTLMFAACQNRSCVEVTITNDTALENTESFFVSLLRNGLDSSISLNPVDGEIEIIDNDGAVVGLERTFYSVDEGVGMVEVCAVVFMPDTSVGCPISFPFTVYLSTGDISAVSPMDYGAKDVPLMFDPCDRESCTSVTIFDDEILENTELFNVTLERNRLDDRITLNPVDGVVEIMDNDRAIVGLEKTFYQVREDEGKVEVCAIVYRPNGNIACPIDFAFDVELSTSDGDAVSTTDYGSVMATLMFSRCENRSCVDVPITDDLVLENIESFFVTLERNGLDSRIDLEPVDGEIEIIDNDVAVVGLEMTEYTVTEGALPAVEVCTVVYQPDITCPIAFPFSLTFQTSDFTAVVEEDYLDSDTIQLFGACARRRCVFVPIVDDNIPEVPERLLISIRDPSHPNITLNPDVGFIEIDDIIVIPPMVNDTLTGDPLMTVPVNTNPNVSTLCYEVHGQADKFFNLVSDTCVAVNAHYADSGIINSRINLNVVDTIGVRAVNTEGDCVNIQVKLEGCAVTVEGLNISTFRDNGIVVRQYSNRVRISVPNCDDKDLVMWVFCRTGRTEDPVTWEYFSFNFLRFMVMRGLNLDERSHGLIGQFWNVPVTVTENTGTFQGRERNDDYVVSVGGRKFVGLLSHVTWEFEEKPCLYAGNSQAGPLGETVAGPPGDEENINQSVIEGTYADYEVDVLFSPRFKFAHIDEDNCMTIN